MEFLPKKLVREWSWRVDNGMPDYRNPLHLIELKNLLIERRFPHQFVDGLLSELNTKFASSIVHKKFKKHDKKKDQVVHTGQNPTTFYHEVLCALACAGVNMANVNNGDDMKKYMGKKVKAGVPGTEIKDYPEKKYMENSTHSKFDSLKKDGINLAKEINKKLGTISGPVWWSGPTNDSSDYGAADIVAKFNKYGDNVGVSLKYEKGQLKNLTVTTLGKALNLKNFNTDYIMKKYKKEFDGMTKDWLFLIFKEFKKQVNANKKLKAKEKTKAIKTFTSIRRLSNTWDKYQKSNLTKDQLDLLLTAVDMKKFTNKKFRYFCRKFQQLKIAAQWTAWSKKRNKRWDNIYGAAFKENDADIEKGLITLFQRQLSMGEKDMFYAANGGKTFWFIPSEKRFEDLVGDIHLDWATENTGSGYEFILTVYSAVTSKKIATINVVTRYTNGQMDGIGSKSN